MATQRRIIVDDTDSRIKYSGDWFQDNGSQDQFGNYGPTYKHTLHGTTGNNSMSFSFSGTAVTIMGTTNLAKIDDTHYDPMWECFVDQISIGSTSPFQYRENNWNMCGKDSLNDGPHEITLKVTTRGGTFWLDAITFAPSAHDTYGTEVLVVDDNDPGVQYGDGWQPLGTTASFTGKTGSTARLSFVGTGLSWLGFIPTELPHAASTGSYSIDGGSPVSFSLNGLPADAKTTIYNQVFFTTPDLPAGTHEIVVTYNGDGQHTPLTLDYIYLTNTSIPQNPTSPGAPTNTNNQSSKSPSGTPASNSALHSSPTSPSNSTSASNPGSNSSLPNSNSSQNSQESSTSSSTSTSKKSSTGTIVGGIVGGVLLVAIIILLVMLLLRKRKRARLAIETRADPTLSPFMSGYYPNMATADSTAVAAGSQPYIDSYGSQSHLAVFSHGQHPHQGSRTHTTNASMSFTDPSTSSDGYNWGVGNAVTAPGVAGFQPLRKGQEARMEHVPATAGIVHHEDSGIRIPPQGGAPLVEVPPVYTPS